LEGEQDKIRKAKYLYSIYEHLQHAINRIKARNPGSSPEIIAPDLIKAQKEIIKEYDELYLLLKVRFLMNRKDFDVLKLKYIDVDQNDY
jgi:hypothetical protein